MNTENNCEKEETKALSQDAVMPRFFVDDRIGCIAIRDRQHSDFDLEHQGLDSELSDVVEFEMGKLVNNEWVVSEEVIKSFKDKCRLLNEV